MRKILFLAMIVGVLIGTGIMTVKWNNGTAVVHFDEAKAKEKSVEIMKEAEVLEADLKKDLETATTPDETDHSIAR